MHNKNNQKTKTKKNNNIKNSSRTKKTSESRKYYKQKYKKKKISLFSRFLLLFAILASVCFFIGINELHHRINSCDQQLLTLNRKIVEEQNEQKELELDKTQINTLPYIEKIARERLGLVFPDEIVIRPSEE